MPFLKTIMEGNTSKDIDRCLCFLLNGSGYHACPAYVVSIVYDGGSGRVCVGDTLELADINTGKVRKKRWWEKCTRVNNQLKLPFSLYQHAKIHSISQRGSRNRIDLTLIYRNADNQRCHITIPFYPGEELFTNGRSIRAIRIHQSGRIESCLSICDRAVASGLTILGDKVYSRETGQLIGTHLSMIVEQPEQPEQLEQPGRVPRCRCLMRMLNGDCYGFTISDTAMIESRDNYHGQSEAVVNLLNN